MLTHDKITEIYCIADDFCKEFAQEIKKHQILPKDVKSTVIAPVRCRITVTRIRLKH